MSAASESVTRTVKVIKALAGHEFDGLLLGQIAQTCELEPSTTLRYLESLAESGVTVRDSRNPKVWRLGPALVQIAIAFQAHLATKQQALADFANNYTRNPA